MQRVQPAGWNTYSISQPRNIRLEIQLPKECYPQLEQGFLPQSMDDRWFICMHEGWLHFYRSWSGYEICKAQVHITEDALLIQDFWVETDPERYRFDGDDHACRLLRGLIKSILLDNQFEMIHQDIDQPEE
jgi:hypothetical protein